MKKIIVFLTLIVSLFIGYGQPRTSSSSRQTPSTATVRTPSTSRQQNVSYSTSRQRSPQRPSTQSVTKPSTQQSRTVNTQSSSVSSKRPVGVVTQQTTKPTNNVRTNPQTNNTNNSKRGGNRVPHDNYGHRPGHNHSHGSVPPGYNPPPKPQRHYPHKHHYHHPHYHRNIYLHRVYWNPFVPVFYLDGFWHYTHNHYYIDYDVRTTYVYAYNNINTVQIIDYVIDYRYTYCIQKIGCDKYFRVYDNSNRLIAQHKLHWRYNELVYDHISGGVWCKGNKDHFNLLFIMDDSGTLVCYSE